MAWKDRKQTIDVLGRRMAYIDQGDGASIVLLTTAGYLGARQAGTPARTAMVEGAGAGLLGVVIVVFKALLH